MSHTILAQREPADASSRYRVARLFFYMSLAALFGLFIVTSSIFFLVAQPEPEEFTIENPTPVSGTSLPTPLTTTIGQTVTNTPEEPLSIQRTLAPPVLSTVIEQAMTNTPEGIPSIPSTLVSTATPIPFELLQAICRGGEVLVFDGLPSEDPCIGFEDNDSVVPGVWIIQDPFTSLGQLEGECLYRYTDVPESTILKGTMQVLTEDEAEDKLLPQCPRTTPAGVP